MKAPPPDQPSILGLQNKYCSNDDLQTVKIVNMPPAGTETSCLVSLDDSLLTVKPDSTFSFDPEKLSTGNHFINVTYKNYSGTVLYQSAFNIQPSVTPEVTISANITTVNNLADQVITTATNKAGGGSSPAFTFAKDKAITDIIQAESNNNICIIDPSNLIVGDNWIYVRMRTSEPCFTSTFDVDSIKIERLAVTGLIDPEFPGRIIQVYPNPFQTGIQITGLNSMKKYAISIHNNNGQELYRTNISQSAQYYIQQNNLSKGIYFLSIYDAKKNYLIGSIRLIK